MCFDNLTDIESFFSEIQAIGNHFIERGKFSFFDIGYTKKGKLILNALARARNDVINNKFTNDRGFRGYYSRDKLLMTRFNESQYSLFGALNYNRLLVLREETKTIITLERQYRQEGLNVGFRKLIQLLREKFFLRGLRETRSNDDIHTKKLTALKTQMQLVDQGSNNEEIFAKLNEAKIPGLTIGYLTISDPTITSRPLIIDIENHRYEEIVAAVKQIEPLPNHCETPIFNK